MNNIISRLDQPLSDNKGGYFAYCPCHSDGSKQRRRSLHVQQKDGKILLHCFAGCAVEDIVSALGLSMKDLFLDNQTQPGKKKIVATYDYTDPGGKLLYQVVRFVPKAFQQRRPDGAGGWIWSTKGITPVLYNLPGLIKAQKRGETLFVVEGEKHCDRLAKLGLMATTNHGGAGHWTEAHSKYFKKNDNVVILPDNDPLFKGHRVGQEHGEQVAKVLTARGCKVKVVELPGLPEKGDIIDWLDMGHTKDELIQLVNDTAEWKTPKPEPPAKEKEEPTIYDAWCEQLKLTGYTVVNGNLCYLRDRGDHVESIPLANFLARPTREILKDDGQTQEITFKIEGILAGGRPLPVASVPAAKFNSLSWVAENWGLEANITPGGTNRDRVRHAIQSLANSIKREKVFTHIGWRRIEGGWAYLHAGGAVGAEDVRIELEDSLTRYSLSSEGDPAEGMRVSLALLEVAPKEITLPLWSIIFRAPLNHILYPTVVPWIYGGTGSFKSTTTALFLSHYGGPFDKDNLPASWLSTDNALERLAFLCRDAVLVIDDYAPEKKPREAAILDKRVNRLIRQVGNRAGRGRLRSDLTARPDFAPNAFVVSTGELMPLSIGSIAARIFPILFKKEQIDLTRLTEAQSKVHLLPFCMHGYLRWLAPQMDRLEKEIKPLFYELRQKAAVNGHARLPEAVAHIQLGTVYGLRYAVELGVLTETEAREIKEQSWNALLYLSEQHNKTLHEERPALKFLQTLNAIFIQKKGHLLDRQTGKDPIYPDRFGWTVYDKGDNQFHISAGGDLLGWVDKDGVYLIPEAAWKAVTEYLRADGGFPITERALREALEQERVLVRGEDGRMTRGLRMQGKMTRVLYIDPNLYKPWSTETAFGADETGLKPVGGYAESLEPSDFEGSETGETAFHERELGNFTDNVLY